MMDCYATSDGAIRMCEMTVLQEKVIFHAKRMLYDLRYTKKHSEEKIKQLMHGLGYTHNEVTKLMNDALALGSNGEDNHVSGNNAKYESEVTIEGFHVPNGKYKIGAYVKRAKLNLRNAEDVKAFHLGFFEKVFLGMVDCELVQVYVDITGHKETAKRPEMLKLMRDCADGKINLIVAETNGYLAANLKELCYWLHYILNLENRVDIIVGDAHFPINTALNVNHQREDLIKMADDYIYLNPPDHQKWLSGVVTAMANLREDE